MEEKKAEEALHKEKTRRDYENLREELDELAKQEQEAREAANKVRKQKTNNISRKLTIIFLLLLGVQKFLTSSTATKRKGSKGQNESSGRECNDAEYSHVPTC